MNGQWGYVAISFIIGIAITFSTSHLLTACCFVCYVLFCLYRTSRKTFIFCMIACFIGAMYTTYVQSLNKPLGEPYEVTRGVVQNTPLINGDVSLFQIEDQNKNLVQLNYKIQSASEKKQLQQLHAGISCTFKGEVKEPQTARNFHVFDYRNYLYQQKIHFIFDVTYISECQKHRCHSCNGFSSQATNNLESYRNVPRTIRCIYERIIIWRSTTNDV